MLLGEKVRTIILVSPMEANMQGGKRETHGLDEQYLYYYEKQAIPFDTIAEKGRGL